MNGNPQPVEQASEFALRDLGRTFHELMGVFVCMNLIVDKVQESQSFSSDIKGLAKQAVDRMNDLVPRLQSFYARYQ